MIGKYRTFTFSLAVIFGAQVLGIAAEPAKFERPASRPEGSRLDQPAGSPSSFDPSGLDKRVAPSE